MRLLLAAKKNQATRRNEIMKSYLQLGLSSNKIIHKTASSKDPILGLENLLKTGFAQKDTAPRLLWPTFLVFRTCKHHDSTGPETKQENKKMDQQNNNHTQTKQKTRQVNGRQFFLTGARAFRQVAMYWDLLVYHVTIVDKHRHTWDLWAKEATQYNVESLP